MLQVLIREVVIQQISGSYHHNYFIDIMPRSCLLQLSKLFWKLLESSLLVEAGMLSAAYNLVTTRYLVTGKDIVEFPICSKDTEEVAYIDYGHVYVKSIMCIAT